MINMAIGTINESQNILEIATVLEDINSTSIVSDIDLEYKNLKELSELVVGIVDIAIIPPILFGNVLVLVSMIKYRPLQTPGNTFIASLCCTDLMVGVFTVPLYSLLYLRREMNEIKWLCVLKFVFVLMSFGGSLLSMLAIAYDRWIAVTKPLQYQIIVTHNKAKKIVSVIWIYTLLVFSVPLYWNYYDPTVPNPCNFFVIFSRVYTACACYISTFIILSAAFCFYVKILIVATYQRKKNISRKARLKGISIKQFQKDTRSAKTMFFILFLFLAFWLPLQAIGPLSYLYVKKNLMESLKNFALCIAMCNSFVNPIIYCWARRDFRVAFKKMFGSIRSESKFNNTRGLQLKRLRNKYDTNSIFNTECEKIMTSLVGVRLVSNEVLTIKPKIGEILMDRTLSDERIPREKLSDEEVEVERDFDGRGDIEAVTDGKLAMELISDRYI